ncbi:MAG: hypothetical protein ACTSW1_07355 [Candidatus Hodarchaeales archaeon]
MKNLNGYSILFIALIFFLVSVMLIEPAITVVTAQSPDRIVVLNTFIEKNQRNLNEHIHGVFLELAVTPSSGAVNPTQNVTGTKGIGRILFVVNSGSDLLGDLLIYGTKVDRNTGNRVVGFVGNISINGASFDNSFLDPQGNVVHNITNSYITEDWFFDGFSIASSNLNITDMDVYHISYEQFDDPETVLLKTFDVNVKVTNTGAWFYSYLYVIRTEGFGADIFPVSNLSISVSDSFEDQYYRLRKDELNLELDGSRDGVWVALFFGPPAASYFEDFTMKIWAEIPKD